MTRLSWLFPVLVAGLFLMACGKHPCGPDNCGGCCDPAGVCQSGESDLACGQTGQACTSCAASGQSCLARTCAILADPNAHGALQLSVPGAAGNPRAVTLDFGAVLVGQAATTEVQVKNVGAGALHLEALSVTSPDLFASFPLPDFTPVTLQPGQVRTIPFAFQPPALQMAPSQVYQSEFQLQAGNTAPDAGVGTIQLTGTGVRGVCELQKTLSFGKVARDDSHRLSVEIWNPTQLAASASVGAITSSSGDHAAFTFAPGSAQGAFTIEPGTSKKALIDFRPTQNKSYLAFVKMRASEQCPEVNLTLTGTGVDSVLTWAPTSVDCGYVPPGVEVTRKVIFTNDGLADAELSELETQNNSEFRIVAAAGQDPDKLSIPGGGQTAELTVGCKPAVQGPRQTQLTFATNLPKQPSGQIQLKVFGGGPAIDVQPSPMNFGKVAYFAGVNPPSFSKRKLTVQNVGTAPAVPDNKANLRLGIPDASGNPQPPYFTLVPLNNDTAASEFEVTLAASYDPAKGLVAKAGEDRMDLEVKFTPISVGMKQAKLTIFSNDPVEPAKEIVISAHSVDVPPCNYTVSPTALNFGLISPPDHRDLGFTIKNNGTQAGEICLLSGLSMGTGSHAFFSISGGSVDWYEMAPNEQLQVLVRVHPQGMPPSGVTNISGTVDFFMSSPLKPQTTVTLSAQLALPCLTIAPSPFDFGTVPVGCSAPTRTFSVYNTCSSPLTIHSFGMQSAAGQPSGGANCPGTQPCPEFLLVQAPAIPSGGLSISPGQAAITFQARYKPIDIGFDTGAIAVTATQSGSNVTYVVPLEGKGDAQGIHTETFAMPLQMKADVLLNVDNSCSMATVQASIGANFSSFIKFADSAQVDYRLAVITTDDVSSTHGGRFVFGPTHPEKILTPTTVDLVNKFKAKVAVGTNGHPTETCLSPLLKALTAPLAGNENAGFVRSDASLAMLCITDAPDQSGKPASFYLDAFWNLKGHDKKTRFTFNAIAGLNPSPPSGCPYDSGPDDGSYALLVSQTSGAKDEICTPNWANTLEEVGKTAFGFRTRFDLNAVPSTPSSSGISVSIDGVNVPTTASNGSNVWSYDPLSNAVVFQPMFAPEPAQTLVIQFQVGCL
jgi:hypothetical protein